MKQSQLLQKPLGVHDEFEHQADFYTPYRETHTLAYSSSMLLSTLVLLQVLLAHSSRAWPGISGSHHALLRRQEDPEFDPNPGEEPNPEMIGDLATVGATTAVGQSIQNILLGTEAAESGFAGYLPPGLLGTSRCKADTCE